VNEGSVFCRKDGLFCAKYKNASGKWKYIYRKTKAEAKKALRDALQDRDDGIIPANKTTVGMLLDQWVEDMRQDVSERTYLNREGLIRNHIRPALGSKRLGLLTSDDIKKFYRDKRASGLAPSMVKMMHNVLNQAFKGAVKSKAIRSSPASEIKPPKYRDQELEVLRPEEVKRLLDTVRGDRFESAIVLGAVGALRVGEILSLRYKYVSLEDGTLKVRRTLWRGKTYRPKAERSRRTLTLPQRAQDTLRRLAETNGSLSTRIIY
jgi:integrase